LLISGSRRISRGARKLARTPTVNKKKVIESVFITVIIVFQSIFYLKIYQNNIFKRKLIFLYQSKKTKERHIIVKKKIILEAKQLVFGL